MKYLFLDTNIFLHYKGYEDIPWKALLNTDDNITIVLTSIVLREIDNHKDSSKGRIKTKARKISEKFNTILLENQQSRIPLIYCKETPIQDEEKNIFDLTVNDDRFILNVLHSSYPKEDIYVVSNDTNLLLKAKDSKLNILVMDDIHRSAEELTDEEKELKKVKAELARLENRKSSPRVMFEDTNGECLFFEQIHFKPLMELLEKKLKEEAARYPEEKEEEDTNENYFDNYLQSLSAASSYLAPHSPEQIAVYNQMRNEYLDAFKKKEALLLQKEMHQTAFKKLNLVVFNGGTAQTGEMHVTLRFPHNVKIYTQNESIQSYEFESPVKPLYDRNLVPLVNLSYLVPLGGYRPNTIVEMWNPEKTSTKFEYSATYPKLTHGLQREIKEDIYINTEETQDFNIEWIIADANLIDHQYGKLRVIVADKNQNNIAPTNNV